MIAVRVASVPAIVEARVHIAYQNGYFADEGLDVTLEINPDGKTSLDHLLDGSVEIASTMATPFVYQSLVRDDFAIVGKIDHNKIHSAIARGDSGITSADTIVGKRVAVLPGTSGHFFLDSWLIYHGLMPSDIEIVEMNAPDAVDAITQGEVDAMFYWFPFPEAALAALGDNAVELSSGNLVPGSWVYTARKTYAQQNQDVIERFLRAVMKAEAFIQEDPATAMEIYIDVSQVDETLAADVNDILSLRLQLDQTLLLDLENQARWIIDYGYTDRTEIPNYLNFLAPEALRAVAPDRVTVITGETK